MGVNPVGSGALVESSPVARMEQQQENAPPANAQAKSSTFSSVLRLSVLGLVIVLALLAGLAALGGGAFLPFDYEGF